MIGQRTCRRNTDETRIVTATDLAEIIQTKPDPFCTGSDRSILSEQKLYGKTDVLPESYSKTLDTVRYLKSRLSVAHQEGGELHED